MTADASTQSEEPWDQRLVESAAIAIRNANKSNHEEERPAKNNDPFLTAEELGELPSLANKNATSPTSTTSQRRKSSGSPANKGKNSPTKTTSSPEHQEMMSSARRRQVFWNQMEHAADELVKENMDGPDDERAARKAARRRRAAAAEIESQLSDEEEMEEEDDLSVYETTFCGSAILGELCGTTSTVVITGPPQQRDEPAKRASPTLLHSRSVSPRSAASNSDKQEEQTAIEVEYIEPRPHDETTKDYPSETSESTDSRNAQQEQSQHVNSRQLTETIIKSRRSALRKPQTTLTQESSRQVPPPQVESPEETPEAREIHQSPASSTEQEQQLEDVEQLIPETTVQQQEQPQVPTSPATQKKSAMIAAIAKKARDNFQLRKGKPAVATSESVLAKKNIRQPRRTTSPRKSVDEDYASFTATEKRMFIKLINSGMPATEATQKVIQDRGLIDQETAVQKPAPNSPNRIAFWKRDPPMERTVGDGASSQVPESLPLISDKISSPNLTDSNTGSRDITEASNNDEETKDEKNFISSDQTQATGRGFVSPIIQKLSSATTKDATKPSTAVLLSSSSDDLFPFERTGVTYFDATRREKDEHHLYEAGKSINSSRNTSRMFAGKSPGFLELKESPKRSASAPRPSVSLQETTSQNRSLNVTTTGRTNETQQSYHVEKVNNVVQEKLASANLTAASLVVPMIKPKRYHKFDEERKIKGTANVQTEYGGAKGPTKLRAPSGDEAEQRVGEASFESVQQGSMDMDTYLDSTKRFVPENSAANESTSVYTMGTNVTSMTSYTSSTRTRRPGAAKSRLAKHKQQETEAAAKQLGWRQSIQAAAQTNNRKWDPEHGWIDYEEPEVYSEVGVPSPTNRGKIKLDLDKSKLLKHSSKDGSTAVGSTGVTIPFPDEWAQEREAMIQAKTSFENSNKRQTRGWVESMRIAAAQQARDGDNWDPDQGWNHVAKKIADSVDFGSDSRPLQLDTRTLQPVHGVVDTTNVDEDPFLNENTEHLSTDDDNVALLDAQMRSGPRSPIVEVIKQRVDENDLSHFSPTYDRSYTGPVDVDEMTIRMEMESKDHHVHDAKAAPSRSGDGKDAIASEAVQVESERTVDQSLARRIHTSSKNVPRLGRSVRDTSPIPFHRTSSRASSPEDDILFDVTKAPDRSGQEQYAAQPTLQRSTKGTSIKELTKSWETRILAASSGDGDDSFSGTKQQILTPGSYNSAGWKTFLGKKVQEKKESGGNQSTGNVDTTFDSTKTASKSSTNLSAALNISDISPIANKSEEEAEYGSSAYGPSPGQIQTSSFMKRLSECANPVMASTYKSRSMIPPDLCGQPDSSLVQSTHSASSEEQKYRSAQPQKGTKKPSTAYSVATNSVASEDFGVKTAYLDAVAIKTAVSRSRRPTSRRRARPTASGSVASSTATDPTEKWRQLLEKRRSSGKLSSRLSSSDISRATEKYASDKVSEIMQNISARSKSVARSREVHREHHTSPRRPSRYQKRHPEDVATSSDEDVSVRAAEELAAARVEAMMAALSTDKREEGEI